MSDKDYAKLRMFTHDYEFRPKEKLTDREYEFYGRWWCKIDE